MNKEEYIEETKKHILNVCTNLRTIIGELTERAIDHDNSKLENPELPYFMKYTPKLKKVKFNSPEYKQFLKDLKPALEHHYANNRHHPEHHKEGIQGMNLVDLCELFCDWASSAERTKDGDIRKSCEILQKRFNYSDELKQIFLNTCELLK